MTQADTYRVPEITDPPQIESSSMNLARVIVASVKMLVDLKRNNIDDDESVMKLITEPLALQIELMLNQKKLEEVARGLRAKLDA